MSNIDKFAVLENKLKTNITKQELAELLCLSEREVRMLISELAKEKPVLFNSGKSGYKLADNGDDIDSAIHARNELRSRIDALKARERSISKWLNKIALAEDVNNV